MSCYEVRRLSRLAWKLSKCSSHILHLVLLSKVQLRCGKFSTTCLCNLLLKKTRGPRMLDSPRISPLEHYGSQNQFNQQLAGWGWSWTTRFHILVNRISGKLPSIVNQQPLDSSNQPLDYWFRHLGDHHVTSRTWIVWGIYRISFLKTWLYRAFVDVLIKFTMLLRKLQQTFPIMAQKAILHLAELNHFANLEFWWNGRRIFPCFTKIPFSGLVSVASCITQVCFNQEVHLSVKLSRS